MVFEGWSDVRMSWHNQCNGVLSLDDNWPLIVMKVGWVSREYQPPMTVDGAAQERDAK